MSLGLTGKNLIDQQLGGKDQYHIHETGIGTLITGGLTDLFNLPKVITGETKSALPKAWEKATQYYAKNPNRLVGELGGEIALGILTAGAGTLALRGFKAISPIAKGKVQLPDGTVLGNVLIRKSTNEVIATYKSMGLDFTRGLDPAKLKLEKIADYKPVRSGGEIDMGGRGQAVWSRDKSLEYLQAKGILDKSAVEKTKASRNLFDEINKQKDLPQITKDQPLKGTTPEQSKSLFTGLAIGQKKYGLKDIHGSNIVRAVVDDDTVKQSGKALEPGDIDAPIKITLKDRLTRAGTKKKDQAILSMGERLKQNLKPGEKVVYENLGKGGKSNRGLYLQKPDGSKVKKAEVLDKDSYGTGIKETGYLFGGKIDYSSKTYSFFNNKIRGIGSRAQLAENIKQTTALQPGKKAGQFTKSPDTGRMKDIVRTYQTAKQYGKSNPKIDDLAEQFRRANRDAFDNIPGKKSLRPDKTRRPGINLLDDISSRSVIRDSPSILRGIGKGVGSSIASQTSRIKPPGSSRLPPPPPSRPPSKIPPSRTPFSKVPVITLSTISTPPSGQGGGSIITPPPKTPPSEPPLRPPPKTPSIIYDPHPPRYPGSPGSRLPPGKTPPPVYPPAPPDNPPVYPPVYPPTPPKTPPKTPPILGGGGGGTSKKPLLFWQEESKSKIKSRKSKGKVKQFVGNTFKDYAFGFTGDTEITYSKSRKN